MLNLRRFSAAIVLFPMYFGAGCIAENSVAAPNEAPADLGKPVPVVVGHPTQQTVTRSLNLPATVYAEERIVVRTRITGYLQPYLYDTLSPECRLDKRRVKGVPVGVCRFEIGDRVEKGEVLAIIQTPEIEAEMAKIKARRATVMARTTVGRAKRRIKTLTYTRLKKVIDSDARLMARQKVDLARLEVSLASAEISASRAQLKELAAEEKRLETLLAFREVKAPFAGIVTRRYATSGALVGPGVDNGGGDAAILELSRQDLLLVRIPIPESEAGHIREGETKVQLSLPQADIHEELTIMRTRRDIDVRSRTLTVELRLREPKSAMPGMLGEAVVIIEKRKNSLIVPATAVVGHKGKIHVFLFSNGKAVKRDVITGVDDGKTVEITKGLTAEDNVILQARGPLSDGTNVIAVSESGAKE